MGRSQGRREEGRKCVDCRLLRRPPHDQRNSGVQEQEDRRGVVMRKVRRHLAFLPVQEDLGLNGRRAKAFASSAEVPASRRRRT